jgi:TP901 family phage tail tape measure protein
MAKNGRIEEKNIVNSDVYEIGRKLADSLKVANTSIEQLEKIAISSFENIKKSTIELAGLMKQVKSVKSEKEFLEVKKKEIEITTKLDKAHKTHAKTLLKIQKLETEKARTQKGLIEVESKQLALEAKKAAAKKRNTKLTAEEKLEIQRLNKAAKQAAIISSKLSTEYERQSVTLTRLRRSYKNVALKYGENSKAARKLQGRIQKLDRTLKRVDANVGQYARNVGNYTMAMNSAGRAARSLASAMGVMGGAFFVAAVIRDAGKRIIEFDNSMQNLAGILRTDREELEGLEQVIIDVASKSIRTAGEIAKLAESLVTLGKTPEEVEKLLSPVTNLSIGLQASTDEAGEFLVQMLNAFGASTEEAAKYADQIATIRTSTSLDFQRMRDSFQYIAPISKLLNKDLAYTGSVVGILSDNGIKAESAGRLLATAQVKLAKNGKTLAEGLEIINKAYREGKRDVELMAEAGGAFDAQAVKVAITLARNTEAIETNAQAIRDNSGALDDLVNSQLDSLGAQLQILVSNWERYILELNNATGTSNILKDAVGFLARNLSEIIATIGFAVKAWLIYKAATFAAGIQQSLMAKRAAFANQTLILQRLASIRAAQGLNMTSVASLRAGIAFKKFNAILKANALGIVITLLGGLVYWLGRSEKTTVQLAEETHKLNKEFLSKSQKAKETSLELSKLSKRHDELIEKSKELGGITKLSKDEQKELDDIIKKIAKNVPDATKEIDKYGKAISISTGKVEEFNDKNIKLLEKEAQLNIKNQTDILKKLQKEQKQFNDVFETGNKTYVKGFGVIQQVGDQLFKLETISGKFRNTTKRTKLTLEQEVAYRKAQQAIENKIKVVKQDIESNNEVITSLKGGLTEKQKIAKAEKNQAKEKIINNLLKLDSTLKANDLESKSIEDLRKLYKALNEEKNGLSMGELGDKIKELREARDKINENDAKALAENQKLIDQYQERLDKADGKEKKRARVKKMRTVNQRLLVKEKIKQEIEAQKEIFTNEEESYYDRMLAIGFFFSAKKKLLDTNYQIEQEENKNHTEKLKVAEIQYNAALKKLKQDQTEESKKLLKNMFDERIKIISNNAKKEVAAEKKELDKARNNFESSDKKLEDIEAYEKKVAEIKQKYALEGLKSQVQALKDLLKFELFTADQRLAIEAQIAALSKEIDEQSFNQKLESAKEEAKERQELLNMRKEMISGFSSALGDALNIDSGALNEFFTGMIEGFENTSDKILTSVQALGSVVSGVFGAIYDANIQKLEDQIQTSDEYYDKEIENAEGNREYQNLLEQEKEAKRQELEKKLAKEKTKAAKAEKAQAVFSIGLNTAKAILSIWAQVPKVDFGVSAGLLTGFVSSLGALQIGAVLAKPIPKFKDGHYSGTYEGLAITNDGRKNGRVVQEFLERRGVITPIQGKDTVINMQKGDIIHKDAESAGLVDSGGKTLEDHKLDFSKSRAISTFREGQKQLFEFQRLQREQLSLDKKEINKAIGEAVSQSVKDGFRKLKVQFNTTTDTKGIARAIEHSQWVKDNF